MHSVLTVITGLYILYYIWWRATYSMNEDALVFSIVLLIAEVQGVINYCLYALMTWNIESMPEPILFYGASVDVFVPTSS